MPRPYRKSASKDLNSVLSPLRFGRMRQKDQVNTPRVPGKLGGPWHGPKPLSPPFFPGVQMPTVANWSRGRTGEQEGRDLCLQGGGWGKDRSEGEGGGPRHTSQFSGGSPGWQDEKAWLGFRTLGGRRPGPPGSDPRRRQASPPTFFRCLSRPPFTYQGKR